MYEAFKNYSIKENACALHRIAFLQTPRQDHQHLDIGCGPGAFTRDYLVPRSWPCKNIVAVDKSRQMIEYARQNSDHENITFEIFDFGGQDIEDMIANYGTFDRIYSFLNFQGVKDGRKAYVDLSRLLTPGSGECLIFSGVSNSFTDAWMQMHLMDRWRQVIPDPMSCLSDYHKFMLDNNFGKIESEIRGLVTDAEMETIACHVFESEWPFPNVKTFLESSFNVIPFVQSIPECDIEDAKTDWARLMQASAAKQRSGFTAKMVFYCLHAKSAS